MADKQDVKKSEKPAEKKPNIFVRFGKRISRWVREMRSELIKVLWPTRAQVVNNSWVVLVTILVFGVMIAIFDYVMNTGVSLLTGLTR
ncbi:hypothetical protein FACS18949_16050 [Clostridia bacterium]|nr:hypothetical protein FACS18949_16050 [Clostridia bacterium]